MHHFSGNACWSDLGGQLISNRSSETTITLSELFREYSLRIGKRSGRLRRGLGSLDTSQRNGFRRDGCITPHRRNTTVERHIPIPHPSSRSSLPRPLRSSALPLPSCPPHYPSRYLLNFHPDFPFLRQRFLLSPAPRLITPPPLPPPFLEHG